MKRYPDFIFILLLTIMPIVFHWRILTPNALDRGSFPQGDFGEQFYAFAAFAFTELSQGRLPLWNPYTYAGHPFIADVQSAVFYPPSLVVMFVAQALGGFSLYALEWQAVLHFSLAGMFTYLFARRELVGAGFPHPHCPVPHRERCRRAFSAWHRVNVARASAFLSALVFTFGGYLTAYPSQQLAVLETDVWLPLVLWCLSGAFPATSHAKARVARAEIRHLILAGVCFGVALLAGHPQSALYLFLVACAFTVFRARFQQKRRWLVVVRALAVWVVVALGVSAAQWIPSLEFIRLSSRQSLSYADYARGFELQDPLQMLLPGSVSFYSPLYIGIAPLALVCCALWCASRARPEPDEAARRERGVVAFWFLLALFALLLSFGGNLFFYPLLYLFAPVFALFRQQERAVFIFSFALALLAGYGALALSRALPRDAHRHLRAILRFSLGGLGGAIVFFILIYFAWMVHELNRASPFREASQRVAWLALMVGLWCGLLWARLRGRLRGVALCLIVAAVAALDLFTVNWHVNFQPAPLEAQTRAPTFLEVVRADASVFRTFNEYRLYGNFGDVFRIEDTWGASPLRTARYEQFHKLPMERIWHLLNVKYVITWRKSLAEMGVQSEVVSEAKVSEKETTYVHRLLKASPRASLVDSVTVAASEDESLKRLSAPDFDFTRQVVVESPLQLSAGTGAGAVQLMSRTANSSAWLSSAPGERLFVLAENFYPGWRVFVDGRETPIMRANDVMMAAVVPPGEHRVEWVFDPFSVRLGIGISLLSVAAVLGALGMSVFGRAE